MISWFVGVVVFCFVCFFGNGKHSYFSTSSRLQSYAFRLKAPWKLFQYADTNLRAGVFYFLSRLTNHTGKQKPCTHRLRWHVSFLRSSMLPSPQMMPRTVREKTNRLWRQSSRITASRTLLHLRAFWPRHLLDSKWTALGKFLLT